MNRASWIAVVVLVLIGGIGAFVASGCGKKEPVKAAPEETFETAREELKKAARALMDIELVFEQTKQTYDGYRKELETVSRLEKDKRESLTDYRDKYREMLIKLAPSLEVRRERVRVAREKVIRLAPAGELDK